jgi:tRNA A37 threonylcarbamoyladenosine modification protein TsaB
MYKKVILSIDALIGNGSLSILENIEFSAEARVIGSYMQSGKRMSAEKILQDISDLLERNRIKKEDIETILITELPPVSTGIRIGLATAAGLSKGLGTNLVLLPILDVLLAQAAIKEGRIIAALEIKNKNILWKIFEVGNDRKISITGTELTDKTSFLNTIMNIDFEQIVTTGNSFIEELDNHQNIREKIQRINKDDNFSLTAGKYFLARVR